MYSTVSTILTVHSKINCFPSRGTSMFEPTKKSSCHKDPHTSNPNSHPLKF